MHQSHILGTFNLHNVICQLFLNNTGTKKELACVWKWKLKKNDEKMRGHNLNNRLENMFYYLSRQWKFKHVCSLKEDPIEILKM